MEHDHLERPALVGRQRLSQARAEARRTCRSCTGLARRVIIEDSRATGVEIERGGQIAGRSGAARGDHRRLRRSTRRSCCMLSGIGPAGIWRTHGIAVVRRPARRRRRICRTIWSSTSRCDATQPITLYSQARTSSRKALIGAQWLFFKTGSAPPTISRPAPSSARRPGVDYPDIQYHFLPGADPLRRQGGGRTATASRPMSGRCARSRAARSRCARADPRTSADDPLQLHVADPTTG